MKQFFLIVFLIFIKQYTVVTGYLTIADFTQNEDAANWKEHSDIIMPGGKSKASLVLLETKTLKRAVLFTLLNPQNCGAAFAGAKKNVSLDLSTHSTLKLKTKSQGQYNKYKFLLRHRGENGNKFPAYITIFEAPTTDFDVVTLDLKEFKPYFAGKLSENSTSLDKSKITTIGILAFGGLYLPKKQSGVASLEIEWIQAH